MAKESAQEFKQKMEETFDGAAAIYDRTGPRIFTQFGNRLIEHMNLQPNAHVLDVATGAGAALLPAARCVGSKGHVTGIDLSNLILQEAERAVTVEKLANVELRKMDAEHLEFGDQTYDAATCAFGLFFFPDIGAALNEMSRVTKSGGSIGVSLFGNTPFPFDPGWPIFFQQLSPYLPEDKILKIAYSPRELETLLEQFGFKSIEIHSELNDIVYENLEDWWAFQLSVGTRGLILSMCEDARSRFKDEYLKKLQPFVNNDGLHLSVNVLYAIARQ